MGADTINISRNQIGIIVSAIAILTFAWNIASDYNHRGARIEKLEYQLSLSEAKDLAIENKYEKLLTALNDQRIEFERLRTALKGSSSER